MEYLLNKCKKLKIKTFVDTKIKSKNTKEYLLNAKFTRIPKLIEYKARSNFMMKLFPNLNHMQIILCLIII